MEEKLDGERIQLHMRGSGTEWFYCSRKAKDYSSYIRVNQTDASVPLWVSHWRGQLDPVHLWRLPG